MSRLNDVKRLLLTNGDVSIVDTVVRKYNASVPHYWGLAETVDFIVAPNEGVFDAEKLQNLMMQLVPNIKPTCVDSFRKGRRYLSFGKLYFDEIIGIEKKKVIRNITITDEDVIADNAESFVDGKLRLETNGDIILNRRTWVSLYPSVEIAQEASASGGNSNGIETSKLPKKLLDRILGR